MKRVSGKRKPNLPFPLIVLVLIFSHFIYKNPLLTLFYCDRVRSVVSKKLKPFMSFDYVTIYHTKVKFTKLNLKNIKNFRIEWRVKGI